MKTASGKADHKAACGSIERTLFILGWLQSKELRRRVQARINRGEARNALARAVFFYRLGEIPSSPCARGWPSSAVASLCPQTLLRSQHQLLSDRYAADAHRKWNIARNAGRHYQVELIEPDGAR